MFLQNRVSPCFQYECFTEQQADLDAGIDDEAHPMDMDFVNARYESSIGMGILSQ